MHQSIQLKGDLMLTRTAPERLGWERVTLDMLQVGDDFVVIPGKGAKLLPVWLHWTGEVFYDIPTPEASVQLVCWDGSVVRIYDQFQETRSLENLGLQGDMARAYRPNGRHLRLAHWITRKSRRHSPSDRPNLRSV